MTTKPTRRRDVPPRRPSWRGILAVGMLTQTPCWGIAIDARHPAPAELYGTYGPNGDCRRSPRVSLDATGLYIILGNVRGRVDGLDLCLSCAGGIRYEGIENWLSPTLPGGRGYAVNFRFNADEKAGNLVVVDTGETALGPNLKSIVAASPYQRCGAPTQAEHRP